mgnify:CR=1 FL=1
MAAILKFEKKECPDDSVPEGNGKMEAVADAAAGQVADVIRCYLVAAAMEAYEEYGILDDDHVFLDRLCLKVEGMAKDIRLRGGF